MSEPPLWHQSSLHQAAAQTPHGAGHTQKSTGALSRVSAGIFFCLRDKLWNKKTATRDKSKLSTSQSLPCWDSLGHIPLCVRVSHTPRELRQANESFMGRTSNGKNVVSLGVSEHGLDGSQLARLQMVNGMTQATREFLLW